MGGCSSVNEFLQVHNLLAPAGLKGNPKNRFYSVGHDHEGRQLGRTQCQDKFRNLSGCVICHLTAGRILQISIAQCQFEGEIHSFPAIYCKGGGKCGKN